jgi:hypothetical protein
MTGDHSGENFDLSKRRFWGLFMGSASFFQSMIPTISERHLCKDLCKDLCFVR